MGKGTSLRELGKSRCCLWSWRSSKKKRTETFEERSCIAHAIERINTVTQSQHDYIMNQHVLQTKEGQKLQNRFLELRKELSTLSWITHGSVTPNHPGNWRWTTKVKAKTVTLSLSAEQADLFKEAIAANRKAESILNEMRSISQEILLKSAPGTRKKSSPKNPPKGS